MNASRLPDNPLILQLNTRLLLNDVAAASRPIADVTLADVPEDKIRSWADQGFNTVWLMGVWTTGGIGQRVAREHPDLQAVYRRALSNFKSADVVGSPYSVQAYDVSTDFGGARALQVFRERLREAGLSLILDFVPNHTARDHDWVTHYPERYVQGQPADVTEHPDRYVNQDGLVYAFGRDPYFPGWTDTFQLDYRKSETRTAVIDQMCEVARFCDGIRCDMAMLLLNDVFERTWGVPDHPDERCDGEFWAQAIEAVTSEQPDFCFIAEAYWGLEGRLQQLGFHYTYNKALYDAWVSGGTEGVPGMLNAEHWLRSSLHFTENHDEPRIARAIPEQNRRHAAVAMALTLPGARLVHDGQVEGRTIHHTVQLGRREDEAENEEEAKFYRRLLGSLKASAVGREQWRRIEALSAGEGNERNRGLVAYLWQTRGGLRDLVIVNLTAHEADARLRLNFRGVAGRQWVLADALSSQVYERDGDEMVEPGLYVRLRPYEVNLFSLTRGAVR